jgi:hypothetical protein
MLTWKTAIGIAVRGDDLEFVCLKRGIGGVQESGRTIFAGFRTQKPDQARAAYAEFLRSQGLSAANAIVALPRRDVLLRTLVLPAEAMKSLDKAIEYQVDSLHPFEEGGVDYAYTILDATPEAGRVLAAVVMIEKGVAASYYEWFSAADIPVSGFTTSAAVLYPLAMESAPSFVISKNGETAEILAVSSHNLQSREVLTAHLDRELQLCRAELRLPENADVRTVEQPDIAYAAALSAIEKRAFAVNLLPEARRVYESPWTHALSYALAGVVALLLIAMAARSSIQDYLYLGRVNAEIETLEPKYRYMQKLEGKEGRQLTRITALQALRARTPSRIRVLAELTRLLPPTVSLIEADITDDAVTINGSADSASGLLPLLAGSPQFRNPEFVSGVTKNSEGKEVFRIHMQLTGGRP